MKNSFPISGVGSLPFKEIEEANKYSRKMDLRYVPQLPLMDKWELMIPQTLRGLGGLKIWDDGTVAIENGAALNTPFIPSKNYLCWKITTADSPTQIKIQITGPGTFCKYVKGAETNLKCVLEAIHHKAKTMIQELNALGSFVIVSFDEPAGIDSNILKQYSKIFALQEDLKCAIGLHCCSDTNWKLVLESPCQFISFDTELSSGSLFANRELLINFFKRGGILAPGIVPTLHFDKFDPDISVNDLWEKLSATLTPQQLQQYAPNIVITASCGHAYRPEKETLQTIAALKDVQHRLRKKLTLD